MSLAREALRWPHLSKVLTCDIDRTLVDAIRHHIPSMAGAAHTDFRSEVVFEDAVEKLQSSPDAAFSVIINDLPDPFENQAARSFHSLSFLRMARRKLAGGGVFVASTGPCNLASRDEVLNQTFDYEALGYDVDRRLSRDPVASEANYLIFYGMLRAVFSQVIVHHIPMVSWHGSNRDMVAQWYPYALFVESRFPFTVNNHKGAYGDWATK